MRDKHTGELVAVKFIERGSKVRHQYLKLNSSTLRSITQPLQSVPEPYRNWIELASMAFILTYGMALELARRLRLSAFCLT